jgi:photosystem II stability/assembly factor-like uncharacterized protein
MRERLLASSLQRARRLWTRSPKIGIVAVTVLAALAATGGYIASGQGTGTLPHPVSTAPPVTRFTGSPPPTGPTPTVPNPWETYRTNVSPGNPIQFISTKVGWRINQPWQPTLDNALVSGLRFVTAWPGTTVSETTDGGNTWTQVFSDPTGIWGIDFVSLDDGWAVGVTSLKRTTNGGATWQQVGEPEGTHLVLVDFVSPTVGYGLTVGGQLVQSVDGGLTWLVSPFTTPLQSLCFASATTAYGAGTTGSLFTTTDAGTTWRSAAPNPAPGYSERMQVSCAANDAIAIANVTTAPFVGYFVQETGNQGATWALVADKGTPTLSLPAAPTPLGSVSLTSALSSSGTVDLVGLTPSPQMARGAIGSAAFTIRTLPTSATWSLRTSSGTLGQNKLLGANFLGSSNGWVYLITKATSKTQSVILHTTNGGSSWAVLWRSAPRALPTKL